MNRTIVGVLCLALLCALSTTAFALETKLSGFYKLRAISNNISAGNNFIGDLEDNAKSETMVDQRLRMKLDTKVNENLSFTYYAEVDMQWGGKQYGGGTRNNGGGIGADVVNLETKNLYIDVKIPGTTSAVRLGQQGVADHYDYSFFAADMSGLKYNTSFGGTKLTAGWFKLDEADFKKSDDVTLWVLQAGFKPSENLKLGADYYYYQNQGNNTGYATYFGTADIKQISGNAGPNDNWSATRSETDLHYLGGHGEYRLDNLVLSGWVNLNVGTVDNLTINGTATDIDVQGFAARLKAKTDLGGVKLAASGTYFSGDDDLSDGDADFIVNPLATESFAFATDGFMIMTPDVNWNSVGQYGFAMVDSAWAGYGLISANVTASFMPTHTTYIKGGVGYFASLEDTVKDDRTDRNGTTLGTEVFLRAGIKVAENLDVSINGAYASLGDFYDNNGGGKSANVATTDIDDPYEAYVQVTLSF